MTCHREKGLTPWLTNEVGAKIKEARDAMDLLHAAFQRGGNHRCDFGGRYSRQAFDEWARTYGTLTGREPPSIHDWANQ